MGWLNIYFFLLITWAPLFFTYGPGLVYLPSEASGQDFLPWDLPWRSPSRLWVLGILLRTPYVLTDSKSRESTGVGDDWASPLPAVDFVLCCISHLSVLQKSLGIAQLGVVLALSPHPYPLINGVPYSEANMRLIYCQFTISTGGWWGGAGNKQNEDSTQYKFK